MNKLYQRIKQDILKDKNIYIVLLVTLLVSIIFGTLFITIIKESDKTIVLDQITSFFNSIGNNTLNSTNEFKNVLFSNLIYILIIWLLGISIIGIPIIIFMLFFKGFSLGFSIASIIYKYKVIGVFGAFTYIFPHLIINIIVYLVVSHYALKLSLSILSSIIKRTQIDVKYFINKYIIIFGVGAITIFITSLFDIFMSPYIIKMFVNMIK
jgi:stage II sporulation protein M